MTTLEQWLAMGMKAEDFVPDNFTVHVQPMPGLPVGRLGLTLVNATRHGVAYSENIVMHLERDQPEAYKTAPPLIVLEQPAAQSLIDTLWEMGLRPSKAAPVVQESSSDTLLAVREHLNDMRDLNRQLLAKVLA